MFSSGLLVVHDSTAGGQHDVTKTCKQINRISKTNKIPITENSPELTGRQQIVGPLFNVVDRHIETGRNDSAFVQATGQIDDNLAGSMIVDDLELANVSMLHHDRQELDDHLRAGTEQHLTLAAFLGIVDALQGVGQYIHTNHD